MIIVCPNEIKKQYLKDSKLHNYTFYDLKTIKEKIFFKFHDLALFEIVKKYNVKPAIAFKMMENLYYIDKNYDEIKLKTLFELKEYLKSKDLLLYDYNFLKTLKDEILIDGYSNNIELKKIIEILEHHTKVTIKNPEKKYELKSIYEFDNIESEVRFVAENILDLLNKGIDINKIVVVNINNDYIARINRIFTLFKISSTVVSTV